MKGEDWRRRRRRKGQGWSASGVVATCETVQVEDGMALVWGTGTGSRSVCGPPAGRWSLACPKRSLLVDGEIASQERRRCCGCQSETADRRPVKKQAIRTMHTVRETRPPLTLDSLL